MCLKIIPGLTTYHFSMGPECVFGHLQNEIHVPAGLISGARWIGGSEEIKTFLKCGEKFQTVVQ